MWKIMHVWKKLPFLKIQLGDKDEYDPDAEVEIVLMHKPKRNEVPLGFSEKTHTIFIGDRDDENGA